MASQKIIVIKTNTIDETVKSDNMDDKNWLSLELEDNVEAKLIPVNSYTDLADAAEKRNKEITDIANEVNQLAELFQDINDLVVVDGQELDQIEATVEETKEKVDQAQERLVEARKLQKNNSILFGIIVTLIAGPSVGFIVGLKAGLITALGTSSATIVYDKMT